MRIFLALCLACQSLALPIFTVDPTVLTSALNSLVQLDQRTDSLVTLSYQNQASHKNFSHDNAANPLFTTVENAVIQRPTFAALSNLLAFYTSSDDNSLQPTSSGMISAQAAFLQAVIATPVMQSAQQFLVKQGLASSDATTFQNQLNALWFTVYARKSIPASSGFKSIFAGETSGNNVTHFSNWFRFFQQEQQGNINYHGWFSKENGVEIDLQFQWKNYEALEQAFLLNSSPEFEMALYTICALTGQPGQFSVGSNAVTATVSTLTYGGVSVIDSVILSTTGGAAAATTTKKPSSNNDPQLQTLVDNMWKNDVDKPSQSQYTLNWGKKESGTSDVSPDPLFTKCDCDTLFKRPVYANLIQIWNDSLFTPDVCTTEASVVGFKKSMLTTLLSTWMNTTVFNEAFNYLKQKGVKEASDMNTMKTFLSNLWFGTYSRCGSTLGSSGFEHVFVGEWKSGEVDGQHDWTRYYLLEKAKQINYHGYYSYDAQIIGTFQYTWQTELKKVGGFFFGTSPAFDFSILTVCALVHPGSNACNFNLDGFPITVTSYTQSCAAGTCLSTAYPSDS